MGIICAVHGYILVGPFGNIRRGLELKSLSDFCKERIKEFHLDSRAMDILVERFLSVSAGIGEDIQSNVIHVFGRQRLHNARIKRNALEAVSIIPERINHSLVSLRPGFTHLVLFFKPCLVLSDFFFCRRGRNRVLGRRNYIKIKRIRLAGNLVQDNPGSVSISLAYPEPTAVGGHYKHISFSGGKRCLPFPVCIVCGHGVELGIVVNLERYLSAFNRFSGLIHYRYNSLSYRDIISCDIDFRISRGLLDHFLRTVIVFPEDLGMQQHSP